MVGRVEKAWFDLCAPGLVKMSRLDRAYQDKLFKAIEKGAAQYPKWAELPESLLSKYEDLVSDRTFVDGLAYKPTKTSFRHWLAAGSSELNLSAWLDNRALSVRVKIGRSLFDIANAQRYALGQRLSAFRGDVGTQLSVDDKRTALEQLKARAAELQEKARKLQEAK
jgi:hypothetical protein